MKNTLLVLTLFTFSNCYSQSDYKLDLGVNRVNTAFIFRDQLDNSVSKGNGINFTLSKLNSNYRFTGQYTSYKGFDLRPAWIGVNAYKAEVNIELITHFENIELIFYPFAGLGYNYISGTYTGKDDHEGLKNFYIPNSFVSNKWIGLNCGVGLEQSIKRIVLFVNYRMHIVRAENMIKIMDIGLDAGLKYRIDLKIKKRKKTTNTDNSPASQEKQERKSQFKKLKMPKNRYNLG